MNNIIYKLEIGLYVVYYITEDYEVYRVLYRETGDIFHKYLGIISDIDFFIRHSDKVYEYR